MKKLTAILLAALMFLTLIPCGSGSADSLSVSGDSITIGDLALRPDGQAGRLYENDGLKLLVPLEYDELLLVDRIEDAEDGTLFYVAEKASVEAAKEQGGDYRGAGFLFAIARVSEEELNIRRCGYMTGQEVIARGPDGSCYICYTPTDVRFVRESYEGIADGSNEDWKQWTTLNQWANTTMRESFIAENDGFVPLRYGNSDVEIYLARAAYDPDADYTLSTTEFGPLEPGGVDAAPFVERLTRDVTVEYAREDEAPDGEYAVLYFPGDKIRFDFFFAEGGENYIREVRDDGSEMLYKASSEKDGFLASAVMRAWYDALAESREPSALGAALGGWALPEDIALTDEARDAFDKAMDGLVGVNYTPLALLGAQLVSGTNYCLLCEASAVYPGAQPYYALVYVYADLQGGTEILNITPLDIAELAKRAG
ncbi:MAG: hypothetical protein IKO83_08630 [Oscillospiraceae bacterium]|nr:hypothetical protein [Oscillospiraceae bacterium]